MTSELVKVEFRVKEKTIHFVTRYCQFGDGVSCTEEGEFRDPASAHRAASALRDKECAFQGVGLDDPRITGPEPFVYSDSPLA